MINFCIFYLFLSSIIIYSFISIQLSYYIHEVSFSEMVQIPISTIYSLISHIH